MCKSDSKTKLSDIEIINFLRYLNGKTEVFAVELINKSLDKGESLEKIFELRDGLGSKEKVFGFFLNVVKIMDNEYEIEFGCMAAPDAGDGGEWTVVFDNDHNVKECTDLGRWIS